MKFAKYWEKVDLPVNEKMFGRTLVSVWGGSNESPESAKRSASNRASKFKVFIDNGFDRKSEYEYWAGFIKEEIIEEIKSEDGNVLAVLTRNSYGATVLNTEIVLFGDIDYPEPGFLTRIFEKFGKQKKDKDYFLEKIDIYQKNNPELSIKVYETFAGLRFVVTNDTFDPEDSSVKTMFLALDVDPLYTHLCKQQTCFRARLTPKPWRVGLGRPESRFPRDAGKNQHIFESWLKKYRLASSKKTVTRLLKSFGSGKLHPDVERVLEVHDKYACTVSTDLA